MISSNNRQPLHIFSQAEWLKLYPKKNPSYPHHYSIARGDHTTISDSKLKQLLIAHDPTRHQLTPLIIATMQGNERIVEELLKQDIVKNNINDSDEYGWTALHHAALTSNSIFLKLITSGAKATCRTKLNGTPAQLKALTTPGIRSESIQNVSFEGKTLSEERAKEAFQITEYRDINYVSPKFLQNLWTQEAEEEDPSARYLKDVFKPHAPKVIISLLDAGFHGLFAAEEITPGMIIGDYVGEWTTNELDYCSFPETIPHLNEGKTAYLFNDLDAKRVRNSTAFINNGFPNVFTANLIEGGVNKTIFIAPETIEKGEQLLFSYGAKAYDVTYGPQILFNRDKIHAFFKKGLNAIVQEAKTIDAQAKNKSGIDAILLDLKHDLVSNQLTFPIDNPLCLIDLHFSGIIDAKEFLKPLIENNVDWITNWEEVHGSFVVIHLRETLIRLLRIDRNIKEQTPNAYPLFQKWVLDHCQKLTLPQLMKGMERVEEALVSKKDPTLIEGIAEELKSYDWTKDASNLYSYTNRKIGFERHLDYALLGNRQINEASFFHQKKSQLTKTLEVRQEHPHFPGSELEKITHEIQAAAPKTDAERTKYLAKVKAELQQIQTLLK